MSLISDLRALCIGDATLSALVGARVHAQVVPEGSTLPAVAFWRVGTVPQNILAGPSTEHRARWQFGARANTALEAEQVADALCELLDDHTGPTGSGTVGRIVLLGRFDGWDPRLESYADDIDVAVWYRP